MTELARRTLAFAVTALWLGAAPAETVDFHDVEVELLPASGEIRIVDRVQPGSGDAYRFSLAPWLEIEGLDVDGVATTPLHRDGVYRVDLTGSSAPELRFELRGSLPPHAAASLASGGADGVYLPGYANWLPVGDDRRVDFRLALRLPAGQRAVATGRLVAENADADGYRASFAAAWPGEAPSLFAGPYEVRERGGPGPRVRTYFHAELAPLADTYLDAAAAYLARYDATIGDYPYTEFSVVSAPLPVGLGFPGLTYVGREVLPLPFMRGRSLAHEVLHSWWGNGVAVDYAGGNWAEGLTTYQADYALAKDAGADAARDMRLKWLRDYAALPPAREVPLVEFVGKTHDAAQVVGYNKAAFVFHMLRGEIGDAAFADALREFWLRHRRGRASWQDLERVFSGAAGSPLDWFFAQWLERAGAPVLELGAHRVEAVDGEYRTSIDLRQRGEPYRLRLVLELITGDGVERHRAIVGGPTTTLEFTTRARPKALQVDPDSDLFRRLDVRETPSILRDVTLHPEALTVVAGDREFAVAARALAARLLDTRPHYAALENALGAVSPLLVIVPLDALAHIERELEIEPAARPLPADSSAGAWTARRADGGRLLSVAARDAAALRALLRPLPHYGGQSYVFFDGARALERGLWPVARGPLYRDLD